MHRKHETLSAVARVFSHVQNPPIQEHSSPLDLFPENIGKEHPSTPMKAPQKRGSFHRGEVDQWSMVRRFHNPTLHRTIIAKKREGEPFEGEPFEGKPFEGKPFEEALRFCEWARVLILGGRTWKGLGHNITHLLTNSQSTQTRGSQQSWALFYALYQGLAKQELAKQAFVKKEIHEKAQNFSLPASLMTKLKPLLEDQERFSHTLIPFLTTITTELNKSQSKPPSQRDSSQRDSSQRDSSHRNWLQKGQENHLKNHGEKKVENFVGRLEHGDPYKVYTKSADLVAYATHLLSEKTLRTLFHSLEKHIQMRSLFEKQMMLLRQMLLARKVHLWRGNQEHGSLDTQRIVRIITTPSSGLFYRHREQDNLEDTFVTLLVDNSGSMKGFPIEIACLCVDFFCKTLEVCGVRTEILGFTTQHWKGGSARKSWIKHGCPPLPGRLNNLLHVIYKDGDTSWRRSRHRMGLMLQEGFLKENIDGEALLWAYQRLSRRHESRRILLVISDGAPVDDATISANHPDILANHLVEVVATIERANIVELGAVGIKHDVRHYYGNSIKVNTLEELSYALIVQLLKMLALPKKAATRRGKGNTIQSTL